MNRRISWTVAGTLVLAVLVGAAVRLWQFHGRFVMITVEESSTSAVVAWPLLSERMPGSFIDAASQVVCLDKKPNLTAVRLCLQYSANSQGIEIADSLEFSRTGKAELDLHKSISYISDALDGGQVELVDNRARVLRGPLTIEKTSADGDVTFAYGEERFTLSPGESWAELLALTADGPVPVNAANWETELNSYMEKGYPATRLAIANRGLWPKSGVIEGTLP